jgi:hypothetical protein
VQIVYISNRPDVLRGTLAYVMAFMPFVDSCVVFCPTRLISRFRDIGSALLVCSEDDLVRTSSSSFRASTDHARLNYILRSSLHLHPAVADEFIMSDDDSRPLTRIDQHYYTSDGKHQPFYFYSAERWSNVVNRKRLTSFDISILNAREMLRTCGFTTLLFSSHMPQIISRVILRASSEFFSPLLEKYTSLPEWETYFAFALDRFPERFHPPAPFRVLGWPDKPHWPWYVNPAGFDFENFYANAYEPAGLFAGLPAEFDPASHRTVTDEKIARYTNFFVADNVRRQRKRGQPKRLWRRAWKAMAGSLSERVAPLRPMVVRTDGIAPYELFWLAGLYQYRTGLGGAAALLDRTLKSVAPAAHVNRIDISDLFASRDKRVPASEGKLEAGEGTIVIAVNPPQGAQYLRTIPRRLRKGKRIVGYWWWEYPSFPERWERFVGEFDEVWVSSKFIHQAWKDRLGLPVRWVPLDLRDACAIRPSTDDPAKDLASSGGLKLLSIFNLGSTLSRKNPAGAIAVFRQLRQSLGADVTLTLKVGGVESHPERYLALLDLGAKHPGLHVVIGDLSERRLDQLIGDHDVFLSMHRAEGLGLLMAKAMSRQKAVAATRWSGNLDYMTDATSLLIDCTPTTILDENMNTTDPVACAEPDVSDAASKILALAADRQCIRELGRRAGARIDAVSEFALDHNRLHLFHGLA